MIVPKYFDVTSVCSLANNIKGNMYVSPLPTLTLLMEHVGNV